eukprot:GHVH01009737.1.p1 GENE.GHVH01009737.1~~GHVH01009737.1.p1  ORF type:complete len:114 (-),score=11.09 GHVH01009737.1:277-618(-)
MQDRVYPELGSYDIGGGNNAKKITLKIPSTREGSSVVDINEHAAKTRGSLQQAMKLYSVEMSAEKSPRVPTVANIMGQSIPPQHRRMSIMGHSQSCEESSFMEEISNRNNPIP